MIWEASDVISVVSAGLLLIAIVISLYLGIKSIRLTNSIEKKKYKVGLLNEITTWAIDVLSNCHNTPNPGMLAEKYDRYNFGGIRDVMARHSGIKTKAEYFNNSDLNILLGDVVEMIAACSNLTSRICNGEKEIKYSDLLVAEKNIIYKIFDKRDVSFDLYSTSLTLSARLQEMCNNILILVNTLTTKVLNE